MRCPDCNKFVSMENADPEVNNIEARASHGDIEITADVRAARNCADCGTELKAVDMNMEKTVQLSEFEGFKELGKEDQDKLLKLIEEDASSVELGIEESGGEQEDGGGGRYQKNMITTTIHADLTLTWERHDSAVEEDAFVESNGEKSKEDIVTLTLSTDLQEENAASSYDEQC